GMDNRSTERKDNEAMTTTAAKPVTPEQLAACTKITDDVTRRTIWHVRSATNPLAPPYIVQRIAVKGREYLTCDCPAGYNGDMCWHRRAVLVLEEQQEPEDVRRQRLMHELGISSTDQDTATLARMAAACDRSKKQPQPALRGDRHRQA